MKHLTRPSWMTVLVVLLVGLLPGLAYLQFRWARELGESETRRLENYVETGVQRIAVDLEREILALEFITRGLEQLPGLVAKDRLISQWSNWAQESPHPDLVAAVLWIDPDNPDAPQSVDRQSGTFTPATVNIDQWSSSFSQLWSGEEAPTIDLPRELGILRLGGRSARDGSERRSAVLVLIDPQVLSEDVIASLARLHLGQSVGDSITASVRWGGRPVHPRDVTETRRRPADSTAEIGNLVFTVDDVGGMRHERVALRRSETNEEISVLDLELDPATAPFRVTIVSPAWTIAAHHSEGSISTAVDALRRRHLAAALGVVATLALTIGLLLRAERHERRLAQQQAAFIAGVTHELRTPLTVIRSAAENLIDGVVRDARGSREYGRIILDEGRRLSELVESALALTAPGRDPAEAATSRVDLPRFVDAVVRRTWTRHQDLGPAPSIESDTPVPLLQLDSAALDRAVSNLIENAIKHSGDPRGVRVRLHADPTTIAISVSDSGVGIPRAEQRHAFKPFFRGATARDQQVPGSGLGLNVVKRAVADLGGTISLTSEPGEGSTFRISLPRVPAS